MSYRGKYFDGRRETQPPVTSPNSDLAGRYGVQLGSEMNMCSSWFCFEYRGPRMPQYRISQSSVALGLARIFVRSRRTILPRGPVHCI